MLDQEWTCNEGLVDEPRGLDDAQNGVGLSIINGGRNPTKLAIRSCSNRWRPWRLKALMDVLCV